MQRYRYTGPDEARNLAVPGGCLTFPRMEWVDPAQAAEDAHIPLHHLVIVLRGLGDDWQAEGPVKAARTRKRNETEDTAPVSDEPATPDEEQS